MKILYTNFHHRNGGGHVTYILNLAKALVSKHDVTIATPASSRLFRYAGEVSGVATIDMRYTSRIFQLIPEVLSLRRLIKRQAFDVIHVNASADHRHIMLACLGLKHKPKIIWTKHNDHTVSSFGHYLRAKLGTDAIIAVSAYVKGLLTDSAYCAINTHIVRHGIDTNYFSPATPEHKWALRQKLLGTGHENMLVLGSTGGTDYDKGWLDLARALSLLKPADRQGIKVVVAGDTPNADKLQKVQDLGVQDQLIFPGLLDDVRDTLAACDVGFVLSYREALSFACRESMALGLPTMVSDAGGLPENVTDAVDGWVVPVRNSATIAGVLQFILDQPQQVHSMGQAARKKSLKDFNLNDFVLQTLAVYDQVLDKPGVKSRGYNT